MSLEFVLLALALAALPGPGVLFTVSTGITQGARAATLAAVGCAVGVLPHFVLSFTPVALLLRDSETAFHIIKWLGTAYLIYLAYTLWKRGTQPIERREVQHPWRIMGTAALINLLNPKVVLFFLAFLPRYDNGDAGVSAVLGIVFIAIVFGVLVGYGALAARLGERMASRPKAINYTHRVFTGVVMLAAARLGASSP